MKYIRRTKSGIISILLVLSMLIILTPVSAAEIPTKVDGSAKLTISNPVTDLTVGDKVYVDISIADKPEDLYGYELHIDFDKNYLTYDSYKTKSNSLISAIETDGQNGTIKIAFSKSGKTDEVINDKLVTLIFSSKKSGTASVSLSDAITVSENMKYSEYNNINKSISIKIKSKTTNSSGSGGGGGGSGGSIGVIGENTNSVTGVSPTLNPADPNSIPTLNPSGFDDLDGSEWAVDAIIELKKRGIINGYDEQNYRPNNNVSRAEFTKIVVSALNIETSEEETEFTDIDNNEWYFGYVNGAVKSEIINGYEDNTFRPDNTITRQEAVTIIGRALEKTENNIIDERLNINFSDEDNIAEFAVGYVDKLYTMGVINGDENGEFRPDSSLTRAETAQMIWNMLSRIIGESQDEQEPIAKASKFEYIDEKAVNLDEESSEPTNDSTTEPITEPTTEPITEPTTEPITEPTTEPITEPTTEPITEPTTEPTTELEETSALAEEVIITESPEPSPEITLEPTSQPTEEPVETTLPDPVSTIRPDMIFECESMSEVSSSSNIYAYLIPDDGSRWAFYGDYTTLQRSSDGEAYAVFEVPYADKFAMESYFYAGENVVDFTFQKSIDGNEWVDIDYACDYIIEDGRWTFAKYQIDNLDVARYIKVNYPITINWWTPLISKAIAELGEAEPTSVQIIGDDMLVIPRYDYLDYEFSASLIDQIGKDYQGEIEYTIIDSEIDGLTINQDGIVRVESTYRDNTKFTIKAENKTYGFSTEKVITLKSAILGDLNNDLIVDELDLILAISYYQKTEKDNEWITKYRYGDINQDAIINIVDIAYISMESSISE